MIDPTSSIFFFPYYMPSRPLCIWLSHENLLFSKMYFLCLLEYY
ncbi:competence protein ComK [Peribacillus simplex]